MVDIDVKLLLSLILTALTIYFVIPFISPLWKQVVFIIFAIYTLPFLSLRKEFRSMVYDDDSWKINIKPVFLKETKALFSSKDFETEEEIRIANRYRLYLVIYSILLGFLTLAYQISYTEFNLNGKKSSSFGVL